MGARILAVADALDAMTSDRPYRAARTFEYAKTEILKGSATHFDPEVVTAFIKSQRAIEDLLRNAAGEEMHHHPDSDDLGGWRMHVVGRSVPSAVRDSQNSMPRSRLVRSAS